MFLHIGVGKRIHLEQLLNLSRTAEQLAYDNFYSYGHDQDIAEEEGYDPDEMEEGDWDELWSR